MSFRAKYHPAAYIVNIFVSLLLGGIIILWISESLRLAVFRDDLRIPLYLFVTYGSPLWIPVIGFGITSNFSLFKKTNRFIYRGLGIGEKGLITYDPEKFGGKPYIRNTTFTVEQILNLLANGFPVQAIIDKYPGLTKEQILACINWRK